MRNTRFRTNDLCVETGAESQLEQRVMLAASQVDTVDHKEHNFNDNTIGPFTNASGGRTQPIDTWGRYVPYFREAEYNGGRGYRGLEIRSEVHNQDEGYIGFNLLVPETDHTKPFPDDQTTIIHQWYNWSDSFSNWASHLAIVDNDLVVTTRGDGGTGNLVKDTIVEDIPRGEWLEFEGRVDRGHDESGGLLWKMNEEVIYDKTLDVGWGNDQQADGSFNEGSVATKMGMYAAVVAEYEEDEERYLFFDDIGAISNDDGNLTQQEAFIAIDPN